jgi:class 3 adenylate cyclase
VQTRTRTRTVAFTDMADFTRSVSASDREGLRNLLDQHQRMVQPLIEARGGRIVKGIGDSFMALFESATDGVRACLDLVEAHPPGAGAVTFRASLATGDVEETDNDAFGETVNLSARINARIPAGEVWFSTGTWHCMNQAEIPWESTGRHQLKGIAGEVECFRAVARHAAHFPDVLAAAIRKGHVLAWSAGDAVPVVPPGGHVILDGFRPAGAQLTAAIDALPIADPSKIWLAAFNISPADRIEWLRHGRGLLVCTPQALKDAIQKLTAPATRSIGSDTIILDGGATLAANLVLAGVALPAVPYAEVVSGYSYDLLPDGRWVNRSDRAVLRVDVTQGGAALMALSPGVALDGQMLAVGSSQPLRAGAVVRSSAGQHQFYAIGAEGYVGALVGDSPLRLGVSAGTPVEIGREPGHPGLLLPDRNNQDNIRWCPGPRAARAREKGFTLDKSMTGRRQAAVMADGSTIEVQPLHETCPTLLLSEDGSARRATQRTAVRPGDVLLVGTTVVAIRDGAL